MSGHIDRRGTRVRPSPKFTEQFPRAKTGEGTVLGIAKDGKCLRVKWDRYVDTQVIHPDFLELAETPV